MKLGVAKLVRTWGTQMTLARNGVDLFTFVGRLSNRRPRTEDLVNDYDEQNFLVIMCAEDAAVRPQKYDVIRIEKTKDEYTVQYMTPAGADEEELLKLAVRGGLA